jgi:hypothetical protein
MAQINARNIPDELYHRVRLAAALGGARIPKGALERFVIRALRRAVEDPQLGAGLPRLKLCARCFSANQEAMNAPKGSVVPPSVYDVTPAVVDTAKAPTVELFSHLLDDLDENASAAGMLNSSSAYDMVSDKSIQSALPEPCSAIIRLRLAEAKELDIHKIADTLAAAPEMAVEVSPGLWVTCDAQVPFWSGHGSSTEWDIPAGWSVLSAAKEPWHRNMVGYKSRSAPETAERLFARRGNQMALNLIDVRNLGPGGASYVPDAVIEAACGFLDERLAAGDQVLVHAGDGRGRAPTVAFVWMLRRGKLPREAALPQFRERYPRWEPGAGMRNYIEREMGVGA